MTDNNAEWNRDDTDEDEAMLEKEVTVVKPGLNWGYCSKECSEESSHDKQSVLKETMLTILTNEQCEIFAKGRPFLKSIVLGTFMDGLSAIPQ